VIAKEEQQSKNKLVIANEEKQSFSMENKIIFIECASDRN
jgi:hypothetical protein